MMPDSLRNARECARRRLAPVWAAVAGLVLAASALGACDTTSRTGSRAADSTATPKVETSTLAGSKAPSTPQPITTSVPYGPGADQFPAGINPLSGLPVADRSLLKIPAVLVSISHFPATARPQAGLSFAPFVYEFSITGGETRFLTAFYGQFPAPEVPITGDCSIRRGAFVPTSTVLGNRVWLDANKNGVQDADEGGIPGICVNLLDEHGTVLSSTTTDTNGMYGFNVEADKTYLVQIDAPGSLSFTEPDVGMDDLDSDVDPATGATPPVHVDKSTLLWDAGLYPNSTYTSPTPDLKMAPAAAVGPVRSGRLLYVYLGNAYQDSCLIYAFASPEVLAKLPHCAFVSHEDSGGGEMITIDRMKAVAEDNMRHTASRPFNYASNLFSEEPPAGGAPASQINVFFGNLNQSGWTYDPLYGAYLRYVDNADRKSEGVLHPEVDRLTGRQLHFENVVVVMADTDVITRTNLDIHLDEGNTGPARLFRDGQVFDITWSTKAGDYERRTGFRRPIEFLNPDGSPAALKPGHTWVIIVTPFSQVGPQGAGVYSIRYAPPAGEEQ